MRFSLVLATVGRVSELECFLQSLDAQTFRNFELIVVDQNPDDRLVPILERYEQRFAIVHLRSAPGLSRARNVGLQHVTGDVVAFPDDDCWYPPGLLERVVRFFREHPEIDGLTGRSLDENGRPSVGRWATASGLVNKFNVWGKGVSITIFLKASVIKRTGGFDEDLGAGAGTSWGAGEETDYLLRALEKGFRIYYDANLMIYHPHPAERYDEPTLQRALKYGQGMGRVLRKHRYPFWFVCYQWLRPLGGALLSLSTGKLGKARYHWAVFRGRILGWLSKELRRTLP